jgi:hypothetical protein
MRLEDIFPVPLESGTSRTYRSKARSPESQPYVDRGVNTAPGFSNRAEMDEATGAATIAGQ